MPANPDQHTRRQALAAGSALVLGAVGTPALMGDTWEALVAQARLRPGAVRWASSGIGTTGHLVLEQVRRASGLDIAHIPYKGGGEQIQHALGGQFEVLSTNLAPAQVNLVQAGRLKALALGAPARLQVLPDVRTLAELGFPAANLGSVRSACACAHARRHPRAAQCGAQRGPGFGRTAPEAGHGQQRAHRRQPPSLHRAHRP